MHWHANLLDTTNTTHILRTRQHARYSSSSTTRTAAQKKYSTHRVTRKQDNTSPRQPKFLAAGLDKEESANKRRAMRLWKYRYVS